MNKYSWHTTKQKYAGGWYKCNAAVVFPGQKVSFKAYPFFKPCRKGGHTHNHLLNKGLTYYNSKELRKHLRKIYNSNEWLFGK